MNEKTGTLYTAMIELPVNVHGETHIIVGEWSYIKAFFTLKELEQTFGGYLKGSSSGEFYLGVWSQRICSKFRRILREKGAVFNVIEGIPGQDFVIVAMRSS